MVNKFITFFKNNKYFISLVINIYLLFLGLGWIFIHLYFRFFVEKSPYLFEQIKYNLSTNHFIIFIIFLIVHLGLIYINILTLFVINKKKLSKLFLALSQKITYYTDLFYWRPLEYLHDLIAPKLPYSAAFFVYLEKVWTFNNYSYIYFYSMIFLFDVLAKLILSISFFVDIVVFAQMKYFLYVIPLIFIPIGFSIFLKLFISCGIRNVLIIKDYFLEIKGIKPILDNNNIIVNYEEYEYIVKAEYSLVIDPKEEIQLLLQFENMQRYGLKLKEDLKQINVYITLITSSIYLISGLVRCYIIYL